MGKVVTSKGLTDFVQNGTVTHVPDHKPKTAEKPAEPTKVEPPPPPKEEAKAAPAVEPPKAEDDEPAPDLSDRSRKYVDKQHRLRKEAEESAAEADRLAEQQYNRAVLAERRAEQLARELEEHRTKAPAPKEPELVEPKEDDPQWVENGQFNWRKFTKAQADYAAKMALTEFQKKQADEKAQNERALKLARLEEAANKARKEIPDFDAVMERVKGTPEDMVPRFMLDFIEESESAALLAYHLAKNPEDSQRIAKMKPILGLAELGKLEDRITKPKAADTKPAEPPVTPPERGGAPPPITPIATTASGTVNTDPARMSFQELRAYERARAKKR